MKLSNCLWAKNDEVVITSSWLKRVEKGKTSFEVDMKLWDPTTGSIVGVLNRTDNPPITGPVRNRGFFDMQISNMYLFSEDPTILVTSCWGGKLCFWDLTNRCLLRE